ncbi:MAG: hypothetical protein ACM3PY_08855 [Omnitrophica WOR_2 bacterium]
MPGQISFKSLFVLLIPLLLAACTQLAAPAPTGTILPDTTSTFPPIATPAPTSTSTPVPTFTAKPTTIPTVTIEPTSTPDIVFAVKVGEKPTEIQESLSPDRHWRAKVIRYECFSMSGFKNTGENEPPQYAYEELRLTDQESGREWVIDNQLQNCESLSAAGINVNFWSSNSRYMFYSDAREGVPDGLCGYWEPSLTRLDTANGEKKEMSVGPISPDGTMFFSKSSDQITIWDIDRGEIFHQPLAVPGAFLAAVAWSPDSRSIVLLLTDAGCTHEGAKYLTLLKLTEEKQTFLDSISGNFASLTWESASSLKLATLNGDEWRYNLAAGSFLPISPTHVPDKVKWYTSHSFSRSPDGSWIAVTTVIFPLNDGGPSFDMYYQELKIARPDWSEDWKVVAKWSYAGLGYSIPAVIGWMDNSIFIADRSIPDGCPVSELYHNIKRVDLETHKTAALSPWEMRGASISPDGRQVAYFNDYFSSPAKLIIRNLPSGEEQTYPFDPAFLSRMGAAGDWIPSGIHWSPNRKSLLFNTTGNGCLPYDPARQNILRFDSATASFKVLLERNEKSYAVQDWIYEDQALLASPDGKQWWINTQTGKIRERIGK